MVTAAYKMTVCQKYCRSRLNATRIWFLTKIEEKTRKRRNRYETYTEQLKIKPTAM